MRKIVLGLAVLLVALIAAQFFFAAAGAMSPAPREESYRPHHALGPVIFVLPIATAVLAALARMPGRLVALLLSIAALTAGQVVLTKVAQSWLDDGPRAAAPLLFGLHAINALIIFAVAGMVVRQVRTAAHFDGRRRPGQRGAKAANGEPTARRDRSGVRQVGTNPSSSRSRWLPPR